jgi:Predicted membrane protein
MSDNGDKQERSSGALLRELAARVGSFFHLWDKTDKQGTIETIVEGIEFRGASMWSLIVAILLASIGLNVNSTALIIGAMLISPLMGPIMGAGLALGIYDTSLLKRALYNLAIMTGISLLVSFAYFSLSPLGGTTPELLARTAPTFFDVLVALLGGTAMIIAVSRKSRSANTIAGVAVATALMPPLCTAGYGLASKQMGIFAGAAYLYLINSIFIGFTTFFFTKYLKLGEARTDRPPISRKWTAILSLIAVAFLAPSLYMAYDLIQDTSYKSKVDQFVAKNMQFPDSQIGTVLAKRGKPLSSIQVTIMGAPISDEMVRHLQAQLPEFGLPNTELKVIQSAAAASATQAASAAKDLSLPIEPRPEPSAAQGAEGEKDRTIQELKDRIAAMEDRNTLLAQVSNEVHALFPEVASLSWGDLLVKESEAVDPQKVYTILVKWDKGQGSPADRAKLGVFIKLRLKNENISIVYL